MSDLYLDMRGTALRVLVAEGPAVRYVKTFTSFSGDAAGLAGIVKQVSGEAAASFDKAHIIIPSGEVTTTRYKLQNMPPEDIEKVIRRKLIADLKLPEPVFHFRPVDSDKRQRTYMVELVMPEVAQKYSKMLSPARLKAGTITNSFNANIRFFMGQQGEPQGTSGIFDIDIEAIEVTVLSNSEVIFYERIPLTYPAEDKDRAAGGETDREYKMKLYRVLDAIYKVQVSYREKFPDNPIRKILLCGLRGEAEGVAEALHEAVEADIISGDPAVPEGYSYSALLGLLAGSGDGSVINFIPPRSLRNLPLGTIRAAMGIAAGIVIAGMFAGYAVYENRYRSVKGLLEQARRERLERQEAAGKGAPYLPYREQISSLQRTQIAYYDILRYFANRLPEGIFMERFTFKSDRAGGIFDLVFMIPHEPSVGREQLMTKLATLVAEIPACVRHDEPAISVVVKDKVKFLKAEFRCEAYRLEEKK